MNRKKSPTSMQELLCRQVYGLVRETADVVCGEDQNAIEIEADLLDALAINCAEKRDFARKILASLIDERNGDGK